MNIAHCAMHKYKQQHFHKAISHFSETQLLKSLWVVGKPWKPELWQQLFSEPKMWRLQYFVLFEVCGFCTAVQVLVKTICNIIQENFSSQQSKEVKSLPAIWATRSSSNRYSLCFALNTLYVVSSVRSSNSHPYLLLIQHPTFSDHTGPQHWTFTFWATTAI